MKSAYRCLTATIAILFLLTACSSKKGEISAIEAARGVIERTVGVCNNLTLELIEPAAEGCDRFSINAQDGLLTIKGSSPSAICYAFDLYLRKACNSMVTWSGQHLTLPKRWNDYHYSGTSPYKLRYFLNVCTFGYTTPYWGWERWSKELDLMALHGVNMPLASVASEAIARRVWLKMGLTEEQTDEFFTGAAHLPWHRMGNLNGYDGPLDEEWHRNQIALQHKIIDRMRDLGMHPIAPAFAGFVPQAFIEQHPDAEFNQLSWGGFEPKYNACVLSPSSPYFEQIGKLFVEEWEKEFGRNTYYLSDSFNEMRLPVDKDDTEAKHRLLADYGETICRSITAGNPDAVWVTQGWTFGYQHDFWDKASLSALLSRVPDDKLIIIDLGNDYPKWVWHTDQTWRVQEGFYGKGWIYSYVPNFGGKVLPTGDLAMYASGSVEALNSPYAKNLVGFGSAPEGLENNEVVYELLADMGWQSEPIDLTKWIEEYCTARYGLCNDNIAEAWRLLCGSVYGSLYSYPRFLWQTVVPDNRRKSLHEINDDFGQAVELLLRASEECGPSQLYQNDVIEFGSLWIGELADRHYRKALNALDNRNQREAARQLDLTINLLQQADGILAAHPLYRLSNWVDAARSATDNMALKNRYEANAKRLISVWGGFQEDYAARFWNGMIADYYIPRLEIYFSESKTELDNWEENWIETPWEPSQNSTDNPIATLKQIILPE
ncbi:MAG: alpha-N-acetylglucosaminidase TIM-barrel domain-containing protein [Tidjanibacter sp.]|nr:alpha-N-acetylglucosaminidase TIM-barrel domain-containing protein [Tidjanibacter sp.]